ncbi:MAG TPA: cob(I)yrinic acid a,c-diamide adenosyltransferase, partial [Myxococcaceae bacterium]|nr:cob(I)yrinic acid a,c-diamide adenosyltransferase [Myxococcaceae bacterium]
GGDDGTTGLLGSGRVRKDDPRIEAFGTVDEASSAIGLAKGLSTDERIRELCEELQRGLYRLGAQLATDPAEAGKFGGVERADVVRLEAIAVGLEAEVPMPAGFILPGATPTSGALDLARTVVRRAERRCLGLAGVSPDAMAYLNRMSLLLFILGRYAEHRAGAETRPAATGRSRARA